VTKPSKRLDIKHKYLQQQVMAGHFRLTQISTALPTKKRIFSPSR
jgi:hypothetical protein